MSNLHKLPPENINFLELKKCLRVPSRPYLDEFLQQYFRYVHPFLPLVDETAFWEMYHNAEVGPQFPLIVLQAMLFAACSFVSPGTLEELGYASVRSARRALYEQAKWLYTFETEDSKLSIAQAALLLSYWTPSFEEAAVSKPNTAWLRIAIENARSIQAHSCGSRPAVKMSRKATDQLPLKRLWGCCIVRDCMSAISLRRACQIQIPDSASNSQFSLTLKDLRHEINGSRVYDPRTKRQLITTFLNFAEMCMYLVDISVLLFPYDGGLPGQTKQHARFESIISILACKMTLGRWHRNIKRAEDAQREYDLVIDGKHTIHPSQTLFTNLLHIYYLYARNPNSVLIAKLMLMFPARQRLRWQIGRC